MIRADSSAISVPCFSRPDYYTTSLSVCQGVFEKFFKNFFVVFFAFISPPFCDQLVVSLHIIALSFRFVKRFLTSFFGLELSAFCHKYVVGKLCILTSKLFRIEKSLPKQALFRVYTISFHPYDDTGSTRQPARQPSRQIPGSSRIRYPQPIPYRAR